MNVNCRKSYVIVNTKQRDHRQYNRYLSTYFFHILFLPFWNPILKLLSKTSFAKDQVTVSEDKGIFPIFRIAYQN